MAVQQFGWFSVPSIALLFWLYGSSSLELELRPQGLRLVVRGLHRLVQERIWQRFVQNSGMNKKRGRNFLAHPLEGAEISFFLKHPSFSTRVFDKQQERSPNSVIHR